MIHTPEGFASFCVDLMVIISCVPAGTREFGGKSTCGETSDGGTTPLVLGVVVVSGGAPVVAIVVDVVLADGISDINSSETVPFGKAI